jgi:chromosome segregation ATPase
MPDTAHTAAAMQADIDALRARFPRTADLYREACGVMFFRYGLTPTTNALYQLVRKGSMSVPTEALRRFWSDLRERAQIDLQHADLPEPVKRTAGQLVGEIWSLARQAADESMEGQRQSAAADRDAALAEQARLEHQTAQLSAQLEDARAQLASAEATTARQREELSAAAATRRETDARLAESRAEIDRLQGQITMMSSAHAAGIDKVTSRVLQAEQRYTDLEKRTLVDLDRERTAASKLQKQLETERRASASRIEEVQAQVQAAQVQLARRDQELDTWMAKAEVLADERDRAARQAAESARQSAELDTQLAAERARVAELRGQLERMIEEAKSGARQARPAARVPRRQRRQGIKSGE